MSRTCKSKASPKSVPTFDPYSDILLDDLSTTELEFELPKPANNFLDAHKNIIDFFESLTGSRTGALVSAEQVKQLKQNFTLKASYKLSNVFIIVFVDFLDLQLNVVLDRNDKSRHFAYV
ncbi:hypothetical protein ACO0K7_16475 [Undibacterium sp. Ji67W]|uniref:hypothetical protein n=1 Tax=Undibacterium sp. Ji67W TaxID=3413042 RepID=UPI003BF0556E